MQQEGIDFGEAYALVAGFGTIIIFLAIAPHNKSNVYQFDVKSAFLNGVLDEEVFVDQPTTYEVKGHESKVYRLKRLYTVSSKRLELSTQELIYLSNETRVQDW